MNLASSNIIGRPHLIAKSHGLQSPVLVLSGLTTVQNTSGFYRLMKVRSCERYIRASDYWDKATTEADWKSNAVAVTFYLKLLITARRRRKWLCVLRQFCPFVLSVTVTLVLCVEMARRRQIFFSPPHRSSNFEMVTRLMYRVVQKSGTPVQWRR